MHEACSALLICGFSAYIACLHAYASITSVYCTLHSPTQRSICLLFPVGAGVARAFTDADGSLKACYFKTMLHLELPASWDRLSGQHKSGEAL